MIVFISLYSKMIIAPFLKLSIYKELYRKKILIKILIGPCQLNNQLKIEKLSLFLILAIEK